MKRWLTVGTLLVVLPLSAAAGCPQQQCDPAMGDCNPRPPAPAQSDHCVMTANGCASPPVRT